MSQMNERTNEEEGVFCEVFGRSPRNHIIEFFLEMRNTDYGIADVAKLLKINRATTYNTARDLIKQKILAPKRIIGKTQTYVLNKEDPRVKALIKTFDNLLRNVAEQEAELEAPITA